MKKFVIGSLLIVAVSITMSSNTFASQSSLKIQPLEYREFLAKGEKKKGFIDISNPTYEKVQITVDVQAFKQSNNKGELTFYDSPFVEQGIKTDYETFTLPPRQTLRMMFLVDGAKLPQGNSFAAIFFSARPSDSGGVSQQVRVGTILSLTNQTPTPQHVSIENLSISPLQVGDAITGSVSVTNKASSQTAGVYPRLTLRIDPLLASDVEFEGPLVFPGVTRQKDFAIGESRFGLYQLSVLNSEGKTLSGTWFFAVTGWTRLSVMGVFLIILGYGIYLRNKRVAGRHAAAKRRTNITEQ